MRFRRGMPWPCSALDHRKSGRSRFSRTRRWDALNLNRAERWNQRVSALHSVAKQAQTTFIVSSPSLSGRLASRDLLLFPVAQLMRPPAVISHTTSLTPPTPSHPCLARRRTTFAVQRIPLRMGPVAPALSPASCSNISALLPVFHFGSR
jgi:hypothetical protein